jgi:hypothetical protein
MLLLRPFVLFALKDVWIFWLCNLLTMSVPDKGFYSSYLVVLMTIIYLQCYFIQHFCLHYVRRTIYSVSVWQLFFVFFVLFVCFFLCNVNYVLCEIYNAWPLDSCKINKISCQLMIFIDVETKYCYQIHVRTFTIENTRTLFYLNVLKSRTNYKHYFAIIAQCTN